MGFLGTVPDEHPGKQAINVDNPTLSMEETAKRHHWPSATLGTGTISLLFMVIIVITSLPVLRRKAYNTFYYVHIILGSLVFIATCIHASTDFYFLLPGLVLLVADWAWRIIRGDTGLKKQVEGSLEDAGDGWYRITLPASAKKISDGDSSESDSESAVEKLAPAHPLQTYYLNIPSISKFQNHAFTAAKVGSPTSGPVFLFQRASIPNKRKEAKKHKKEWTWKVGGQAHPIEGVELAQTKKLRVRAEGPYAPSEHGYQTANKIICLIGGTGITGALSIADWFLTHRAQDPKAQLILLWTVREIETSRLAEWRRLCWATDSAAKFGVRLHVSSESGRMDVGEELRFVLSDCELGDTEAAWVYVSGPAGLLTAAEDACCDIESEMRRARKKGLESGYTVRTMSHYVAKWEV